MFGCVAKFVPVGYGIKKLQIICVVEDEKISIEDLSEEITTSFEELVCSCVFLCGDGSYVVGCFTPRFRVLI